MIWVGRPCARGDHREPSTQVTQSRQAPPSARSKWERREKKHAHFSSRRKLTGCWLIIMPMVPRGLFCVHRRRPYMYSTVCQRDRFNRALFFCPPAHLRVIQDHALVRACAHTHVRAHTHAPIEHHMNMVPTPSDEESGEEKKTLVDSYL